MAAFASNINPNYLIHDGNYLQHAGNVPPGQSRGREARDWTKHPHGSLAGGAAFDDSIIIPRSEWDARIEEQEKTGQNLSAIRKQSGISVLDQNGTNYCWCNAVTQALKIARAASGMEKVDLSPASVAAILKGYSNSGGWGGEAFQYIVPNGIASVKNWPANAISRQYDNAASQAERNLYSMTEGFQDIPCNDNKTFDRVATLLLLNNPVASGLNWWSHEICYKRLIKIAQALIDKMRREYEAFFKQHATRLGITSMERDLRLDVMASGYGVDFDNSWSPSYGEDGAGTLSESRANPDDACSPMVPTAA